MSAIADYPLYRPSAAKTVCQSLFISKIVHPRAAPHPAPRQPSHVSIPVISIFAVAIRMMNNQAEAAARSRRRVPQHPLSNTAMWSDTGMKSGEPSFVTWATKFRIAVRDGLEFHEGSGSCAPRAAPGGKTIATTVRTRVMKRWVFTGQIHRVDEKWLSVRG